MIRPPYASAAPAWLRRIAYGLFQAALLVAYLIGSLAAWKHGMHGAGRQTWWPARPVRFKTRPA